MPDLRQTRKNIKTALAVLLAVDVVAAAVLFSPLVGSTDSRREELNQLRTELHAKTLQVAPLKDLDKKVITANHRSKELAATSLAETGASSPGPTCSTPSKMPVM